VRDGLGAGNLDPLSPGSATSVADDVNAAKARGGMLGESADQIRQRIAQIDEAIEGLAQARAHLANLQANPLFASEDALNDWFNGAAADWYARHPAAFAARDAGVSHMDSMTVVTLDGAPLDRSIVQNLMADGKISAADGAARLAQIDANVQAAAAKMAAFRDQALQAGWNPSLEQYLINRDPAKFAALQQLAAAKQQLAVAQAQVKALEAAAPPSLLVDKARLRARLTEMLNAAQQGVVPADAGGSAASRSRFNTRGAARDPAAKPPPWGGSQWETPEAVKVTSDGLKGTIADILYPITGPFTWAFIGKSQSPEEVAQRLKEGMDTITRLTNEMDARQREMDAQLDRVRGLASDLDVCNRWSKTGLARPVGASVGDLRRHLQQMEQGQ
jgi:hypothetical protein